MRRRIADRVRVALKAARGEALRRGRPVGWHDLRRLEPIDRRFGMSRGTPVDRFYIERFLGAHRALVRGNVLEVGDARYTSMFGGEHVERSFVLNADGGRSEQSIVGDLALGLPGYEASFDCLILTQVLPFIFDLAVVARTIRTLCREGATALVTMPGISQVSRYDMDRWGDYWRFTPLSARRVLADAFGDDNVDVVVYGNVLAAISLLHGISAEELAESELSSIDPDYPVIIGVVARTVS